MIDLDYLQRLLPLLAKNNVKHIKTVGLELDLGLTPMFQELITPAPSVDSVVEVPEPQNMPPDLKIDAIHDYDKVLNWSSPTAGIDESPMPLTGEETLAAP